jgi:hypothetical protein
MCVLVGQCVIMLGIWSLIRITQYLDCKTWFAWATMLQCTATSGWQLPSRLNGFMAQVPAISVERLYPALPAGQVCKCKAQPLQCYALGWHG